MSISNKKRQEILFQLNIPEKGNEKIKFFCAKCGMKLAEGYARVVIGERGPYIEFSDNHIIKENLYFSEGQIHSYFDEYLSKCPHQVFVYHQRKTVAYADYKEKMWYIGPNLLTFDGGVVCIDTNKRRENRLKQIF